MTRALHQERRREAGWSIFETMVAVGMIATGLMVLVQQLSIGFRESNANDNRTFAYQKAAALLGEIHNAIQQGKVRTSEALYALADTVPNIVLTTRRDDEGLTFAPDHPMSGNQQRRGQWAWSRKISVAPGENSGLYYCRVEIQRRGDDDRWSSEASTASLFSLLPSTEAPEQVHDVYLLACSETPSLWSDLAELRDHFNNARNLITSQSQAQVRLHWITRLGYGRDPCYTPYVNTVRATDARSPGAYWMPGIVDPTDTGKILYHSELLEGMHRTELGVAHALSTSQPVPSTIADQWNNCLRTPAAWRLFGQRVAAGLDSADEPPLQLLLDDLVQHPERYENAIFVNLHGRGLPVPPLRNYSDAAKDPVGRPGVRVVTHPARLWTPRDPDGNGDHTDTQSVELRVHGWRASGTGDVLAEPITLQIYGPNLTAAINSGGASTLLVDRLPGGVDTTTGVASSTPYTAFAAAPTSASTPKEMWFETGYASGAQPYTWIRLHNTPLVAPQVGTRGLSPSARLYGMDHVPSPVNGAFTQDLATDSAPLIERNTARWRIRIPKQVFVGGLLANTDQVVRVVTRIGTDLGTGQRWPTPNQPLNVSETWTWWSQLPTAVPVTERAQFLGDPRLCPYEDLMATGTTMPHGYNWNFDDLVQLSTDARSLWPCLQASRLQDGFAGGPRADAPRLLQLLRNGLQTAHAVLVDPVDRLAHTLLLGGEIAWPTPTATTGVTMHADFSGGTLSSIDTIDPASTGTLVLQRGSTPSWWAKPWLGELFPDDLGAQWISTGNVPLGTTTQLQWRRWQGAALPNLPLGTAFTTPIGSVMDAAGAAIFIAHDSAPGSALTFGAPTSALQAADVSATAINDAAHFVPPSNLSGGRKIVLNGTLLVTPPALTFTDSFPHSVATQRQVAWHDSAGTTATIASWASSLGTATLGLWTTQPSVSSAGEVAQQSLLLGLRSLHIAGTPSLPSPVLQLPMVQILEPTQGSSRVDADMMLVRWQTTWTRFDGQSYTEAYPPGYTQSESNLIYRVLWSGDNGANWTSAVTDQPAVIGVWPESSVERLADAGTGQESFTFSLSSTLPPGEYLFRIEAWRESTHAHSASHQVRVYLRRSK